MKKYDNKFNSIDDLVQAVKRGCEIEFLYKGKKYGIIPLKKGVAIYEFHNMESEKFYDKIEDITTHIIENKALSDIIEEMKIIFRSL